jgi:DNA (cytosine-5)-methyltransferase 1
MAGKRDKNDPRNSLFMEYLKFVKYFQPKMFVIENVQGILTMKTEKNEYVIDIIKSECENIGYDIKYSKLVASDFGVPQKRKRVFIIGSKKELNIDVSFPEKTHKIPVPVKDILLPKEQIDIKYFHSQKMIDGFNRRKEKNKLNNKGFGAQFLKMEEPSYTISARYYKDGSDALVKYSETEIRMLTEKECASIQSFPDNYTFIGPKKEIYEQIGNAVPPLLAKNIAKHLLKYLI